MIYWAKKNIEQFVIIVITEKRVNFEKNENLQSLLTL